MNTRLPPTSNHCQIPSDVFNQWTKQPLKGLDMLSTELINLTTQKRSIEERLSLGKTWELNAPSSDLLPIGRYKPGN